MAPRMSPVGGVSPVGAVFRPGFRAGFPVVLAAVLGACEGTAPTPTAPPGSPPPAQPQPAPSPPPAPAGLHVSATTTNSITWTWTAVEGATAYEVQLSADEVFDDMDAIVTTTETSYTATGLSAESGLHVRVRAVAGTAEAPVVSAWSSHVTGMSAMPPLAVGFGAAFLVVAEGETTEIPIHYQVRALTAPLDLRVSPILGTAETDDFALASTSIEIPAGEDISGQTMLLLTAQTDLSISEGEETVSLRFVASPGMDAKLGDPIEIRIKETGAAPCQGVTVAALPPVPSEEFFDHLSTKVTVELSGGGVGTGLDFLGPYTLSEYHNPYMAGRISGWWVASGGESVRHEIAIDWTQELEQSDLRLGLVGGQCLGRPVVVCASAGCRLTQGGEAVATLHP